MPNPSPDENDRDVAFHSMRVPIGFQAEFEECRVKLYEFDALVAFRDPKGRLDFFSMLQAHPAQIALYTGLDHARGVVTVFPDEAALMKDVAAITAVELYKYSCSTSEPLGEVPTIRAVLASAAFRRGFYLAREEGNRLRHNLLRSLGDNLEHMERLEDCSLSPYPKGFHALVLREMRVATIEGGQ